MAANGRMKSTIHLTSVDIDSYDPQGVGRARRLCPLCGDSKPKDDAHRSLTLSGNGLWHCHRCKTGGQLREFWTEKPLLTRRERTAAQLRQVFQPSTSVIRPAPDPTKELMWRKQLRDLQPLSGTQGEAYLRARGIACEIAQQSGVHYLSRWFGRPALVFPARDFNNKLVGAQGRYVDERDDPKARTAGHDGVFSTAGAWENCSIPQSSTRTLILTEAPLDALSLAMCGFPAMAVFGCNLPSWMHRRCAFGRVLIATDADEAGDKAAQEWAFYLSSFGADCHRLRPESAKDWNEWLQKVGVQDMRELLYLQIESL